MKKEKKSNQTVKVKKKKKRFSIKWILFFSLVSFVSIILLAIWLMQTVYLDEFYRYIKTRDLHEAMNNIESAINNEDLEDALNSVSEQSDTCIMIVDDDATVEYTVERTSECRIHRWSKLTMKSYLRRIREGDGTYTKIYLNEEEEDPLEAKIQPKESDDRPSEEEEGEHSGSEYEYNTYSPGIIARSKNKEKYDRLFYNQSKTEDMIYAKRITMGDKKVTIFLDTEVSPVDTTVATIRIQLIYITIIVILMTIVLAIILSRKIARPIIKINRQAKELAKGRYDTVFDGTTYREVNELSNTLTTAAVELGKTEQFQRDLIANVSHDLRTPLTMIVGYAEVMRDIPGENNPENVQVVIDEGKRLTNLVTDLLDMSKLQAGVSKIDPGEYDLTDSISAIIDRIAKMTEKDHYHIEFLYKEHVLVYADEKKIYQVLYNLIGNAINYTGDDKRVIVKQKVFVEDKKVRIQVIDTGEGIKKEDLDAVWQRYYKVDKTHKRPVVSNGIGLSISKNILELHQADYGVESEYGHGSTFYFEIPFTKFANK